MTDTATHARINGEENSAAVFRDGWLPDVDLFPELTQLREDHERIRAQYRAESANVRAVKLRIKADKEQREAGMQGAFLSGTAVGEVPPESEALSVELEQAKERARAALHAYIEHINICVATVVEHRSSWLEQIAKLDTDVHKELAQLRAQLVATERKLGSFFQLDHWIDRTGGVAADMPAAHIPYMSIPPLPSKDPDEVARESQRLMEESYAGGLNTARTTDRESVEREDDYMVPAQLSDVEVASANAAIRDGVGQEGVL